MLFLKTSDKQRCLRIMPHQNCLRKNSTVCAPLCFCIQLPHPLNVFQNAATSFLKNKTPLNCLQKHLQKHKKKSPPIWVSPDILLNYARRIPRATSTMANFSTSGTMFTLSPTRSNVAWCSGTKTLTIASPTRHAANFSVP